MTSTVDRAPRATRVDEAPATLLEPPPRLLGWWDQAVLWGNLGITLTLPVAAAFVLQPVAGLPPLTLPAAVVAIVVGSVLGSVVLGLSAVPGADTGAPAMVVLRGLLGRRGSYLPTLLNLAQCVGWAAVEVFVIATAARQIVHGVPRWVFVVAAGVVATMLALRPLGFVRTLRKWAVWLVLAASVYLFVEVLRQGVTGPAHGSWRQFWLAVDIVVALPISWAPLAADYSRHSRRARAAFGGAFAGYSVAAAGYFLLGIFAVTAVPGAATDPIAALLALPVGAVALGILVLDEIDEAFANLYSTAMSAQNLRPTLDRRWVVMAVGIVATLLGLVTDVTQYENFLFLIGSVFIPLFAVLVIDYFAGGRGRWDVSERAPFRARLLVPWLAGFVAYQLLNPGTVGWWSSWWTSLDKALGLVPPTWLSASLTAFVVAAVGTVAVRPFPRGRR
jgi:putative hydroxymethylpyrimidine transporter CytX